MKTSTSFHRGVLDLLRQAGQGRGVIIAAFPIDRPKSFEYVMAEVPPQFIAEATNPLRWVEVARGLAGSVARMRASQESDTPAGVADVPDLISDAEFMAAGLERYGRDFQLAIEGLDALRRRDT